MRKFVNRMMKATKKYTTLDFALLKICLMTIGILLGVHFAGFLEKYISIVWIRDNPEFFNKILSEYIARHDEEFDIRNTD